MAKKITPAFEIVRSLVVRSWGRLCCCSRRSQRRVLAFSRTCGAVELLICQVTQLAFTLNKGVQTHRHPCDFHPLFRLTCDLHMLHYDLCHGSQEFLLFWREGWSDYNIQYEQRADVDAFLRRQRRARVEFEVRSASDEGELVESFVRAQICDCEQGNPLPRQRGELDCSLAQSPRFIYSRTTSP